MKRIAMIVLVSVSGLTAVQLSAFAGEPVTVRYRAVLQGDDVAIPFEFELSKEDSRWQAWLINGAQRVEVPKVTVDGETIRLDIDYFDSAISARIIIPGQGDPERLPAGDPTGDLPVWLYGTWRKQTDKIKYTEMSFIAERYAGRRFDLLPAGGDELSGYPPVDGRWSVHFAHDADPAIAVLDESDDGQVTGTLLTPTGDYGYLAGRYESGRLRLSSFDGGHAFAFDAQMQPDETLGGKFWSRNAWEDEWTARRDDRAELPDGFSLSHGVSGASLGTLRFPDLEGNTRSLDDPAFRGKARIIEVFGSWCPNCFDAARFLANLDRRYRDRGLHIVGLAFEVTGDFERDAAQVRKFASRCGVAYPLLLAGVADKDAASKAVPIVNKVLAFPTTIFCDADGRVRAVHTGFSGPATGEEYKKLSHEFEAMIEALLAGQTGQAPSGQPN